MAPMTFRNYGGVYQLRIESADDLRLALDLPEALWVATSAPVGGLGVPAAQQQVASLSEGRYQAGLIDTTIILSRQQHPGVTRMQRKRQHLAADGSDL